MAFEAFAVRLSENGLKWHYPKLVPFLSKNVLLSLTNVKKKIHPIPVTWNAFVPAKMFLISENSIKAKNAYQVISWSPVIRYL